MKIVEKKDYYNLYPKFERVITFYACTSSTFFSVIGSYIDVDCIRDDTCKLAFSAVNEIAKETGRGPNNITIVVQRLRLWMTKGKVSIEQIQNVVSLLDEANEEGLPPVEEVVNEMKPIIQLRMKQALSKKAIEVYGKNDETSLNELMEMARTIDRVGVIENNVGTLLGKDVLHEIRQLRSSEKSPLGIAELDAALNGGLPRGCQGIILGAYKSGKSMALIHIAATSIMLGMFVVYASLELSTGYVHARILANLTAVPATLAATEEGAKLALEKYDAMNIPGAFRAKYFTPESTTYEDIKSWVAEVEKTHGRSIDVLIVDYADKLSASTKSKSKKEELSTYYTGNNVFEGLRHFAHDKGIWMWTATQAKRKDKKNSSKSQYLDGDDVADSIAKSRVTDLMVSINDYQSEDGEDSSSIMYYVAANRHGEAKMLIGPVPKDFACARMVNMGNTPREY